MATTFPTNPSPVPSASEFQEIMKWIKNKELNVLSTEEDVRKIGL